MRSSLTLIGTVHHDPAGAAPLARLLEELAPEQVTVEFSPEAITYRQTHGVLLLRKLEMILERLALPPSSLSSPQDHPDIAVIRQLLDLPYEYRVAAAYVQGKRAALHAIDATELSLNRLRPVEERLISLPHIRKIASSPRGEAPSHRHRYALARHLLAAADGATRRAFLDGCRGEEGIGPRDHHLAGKIRSLAADHPGHLVHIGGWVHLMEDPDGLTLYSLLKDLNPQRLLVDPYHSLIP